MEALSFNSSCHVWNVIIASLQKGLQVDKIVSESEMHLAPLQFLKVFLL